MTCALSLPPACLSHTWRPVADRVRNGQWDRWAWRITYAERELLDRAIEAGTAVTAQRREGDGFVLLARCAAGVASRGDWA